MLLKINTTNIEEITVELVDQKAAIADKLVSRQQKGSQVLLPMITQILKNNKKHFKDIKFIEVNPGPGSFTGTRVGVAVANALGFALKIPVNGKKGKIIEVVYPK